MTALQRGAIRNIGERSGCVVTTPIGITGDNLCQVTGVNFGSAPATAFKVTEPAPVKGIKQPCTVRAVSPPGTGVVDVTLTSPGGTSATGSQDQFSYQ